MGDIRNSIITSIIAIVLLVVGLSTGINLDALQVSTLQALGVVCGVSIAYCFLVGEITRNNSQMDKLWSILPIIYSWIVVFKSGFDLRLSVMATLISVWGVRLTMNFAKKGAYSLKFWTGAEDYRWGFLRKNKILGNKLVWAVFDLFFISIYQNLLVLATCLPMVACMNTSVSYNFLDIIFTFALAGFIALETIADKEQMEFQTKKWSMLNSGKKLAELPSPYNKGFNTNGLWAKSRHPNYFAEQSIWIVVYLFCISAGVTTMGLFNWSIIGAALLVLLFIGSSTLGEYISSTKYPEYRKYQKEVNRFIPIKLK